MNRMLRGRLLVALLGMTLAVTAAMAKDKDKKPAAPAPTSAPAAASAASSGSASGSGAVATVGGVAITESELTEAATSQLMKLRSDEYNIKRRVLDDLIVQKLIDKEAAARKITAEDLLKAEIEAKAPPVTADETKAFYEQNKARFGDKPQDEVMKMIEPGLKQQRLNQRRQEFINELKAKADVKVMLDPPRMPVLPGDSPSKGPADAPITIVEFSDFQCPFCSRAIPTLKQIEERYKDKVRIVYKDFPLSFHQFAAKASEAGLCAKDQGKFWEMYDRLFANQQKLQVSDLKEHATAIGLNGEQFNKCLDDSKYQPAIQKNLDEGGKFGVTGTPAFFINGRSLVGAQPFDAFAQIINEELERAGVPVPPPPAPAAPAATNAAPPAKQGQ